MITGRWPADDYWSSRAAPFFGVARAGKLDLLGRRAEEWLEEQRELLDDGELSARAIVALDTEVPDWGSLSALEIDYAWHESHGVSWPPERLPPDGSRLMDPLAEAYIEALREGRLERTPRAFEWLRARRKEAAKGEISRALFAALMDASPSWQEGSARHLDRLGQGKLSRDTEAVARRVNRRGASSVEASWEPIAALRARYQRGALPQQDVDLLDAILPEWKPRTLRARPRVLRIKSTPAPKIAEPLPRAKAFTAIDEAYIEAARAGELAPLGPKARAWLQRLRAADKRGALGAAESAALDAAAPGWRTLTASALDVAVHGRDVDDATRFLDLARAGQLRTSYGARLWLAAVRSAHTLGQLAPETKAALDRDYPCWDEGGPARVDLRVAQRDALADSRAQRGGLSVQAADALERHLAAAASGSLASLPTAAGWLRRMRRSDAEGFLPAAISQRLDAATPRWRELSAADLDAVTLGGLPAAEQDRLDRVARSWPSASEDDREWLRACAREELSDRLEQELDARLAGWRDTPVPKSRWWVSDHLKRAQEGRMCEHERAAETWLSRQRKREQDGILTPEQIEALDTAAPGWRRLSPRQLDAARAPHAWSAIVDQGQDFLALAKRGMLDALGKERVEEWLTLTRSLAERLPQAHERALDEALPGWRAGDVADVVAFYSRGPMPGASVPAADRAFLLLLRARHEVQTDEAATWLTAARDRAQEGSLPTVVHLHLNAIDPYWLAS